MSNYNAMETNIYQHQMIFILLTNKQISHYRVERK